MAMFRFFVIASLAAALAGGQVLAGLEREDAHVAEAAHLLPLVRRAVGLGRVLDEGDAVPLEPSRESEKPGLVADREESAAAGSPRDRPLRPVVLLPAD